VTAQHLPGDGPFFEEWSTRQPGTRRSLDRARAVGEAIGTWKDTPPVLTVVGSKGKGTTAVHAAATLSAARVTGGCPTRVGLVSSPGLRTNRERIRLDGLAIAPEDYEELAQALARARLAVPAGHGGYLSPTGAFTIAGAAWTAARGSDVLVLEEGLGGRSDEISLFEPRVVAVTKVFYEHGDLLGPTLDDVARDLLGVAGPTTRTIVTLEQDAEVTALVEETAARLSTGLVTVTADSPTSAPAELPPISRLNAALGEAAARAMASALGWPVDDGLAAAALASVRVPGRLSRHAQDGVPVMVDGAISPDGIAAAVADYQRWHGRLDTVVASFPDTKDVEACFAELRGFERVIPARADDYLKFSRAEALHGEVLDARAAIAHGVEKARAETGGCLLIGTQSYVGIALDVLDVQTDRAFTPSRRADRTRGM
jgi:dihydrofolate synthase/folylpolyglutamate synthase